MTLISKFSPVAASLLCATTAWSADFQVKRSLELPSTTPQVWHLIGDFCDIDDWHPKVSSCSLKVLDGSLVRVLKTDTGDQVTQKRIAQEEGLSYTYKTISSALPIEKYTATLSVQPGENLLIEWIANFSSDDPAMERVVVDDIEGGLSAIESIFASR
ncbi:SRPBCC family protein [Aliiroseovarius sp. S2029]|uniref:SRPBCC family protein n=1 Tax=Aliiroseovarius sp. S2029 TaxID=2936988 RepID=UPI0020BFE5E3|nr:SRPBCC family protein [Aliiroseovarius sp. S2029]MCK8482966.1 SRPBCC family protein [Aliiroseovarius sp. S2029]